MLESLTLVLLVGAGSIAAKISLDRQRLRRWEEAVTDCGLQVEESSSLLKPRLRARSGPVTVRLRSCGDKGKSTLIVVQAPASPELGKVRIRPEPMIQVGGEIEVGDGRFDDAFRLEGPPQVVLALLDAKTRRLLSEVKERAKVEIAHGELRSIVYREKRNAGLLPTLLPALLEIARHLPAPQSMVERLTGNATRDPEPGVRLQNLLLLARELPGSPETEGALRQACSDTVPGIRLQAARELGAEGRGVLLELAEGLEDDGVSAEAVAVLAPELAFERLVSLLSQARSRRSLRTARAGLEALGRLRDPAVETLTKVLEEEYGELAPAAARALGETGSAAAEPALLQALARDDAEVRVAAAEALGHTGTAAAVLPLQEAAGLLPGELHRAARQAIAEIQSRLHGAAPGQLTLAGAETGQLSLAQEGGELSLAEDPAGQLSLPPGQAPA